MCNTFGKTCTVLLVSSFIVSSCFKKPLIENTPTVDMSGHWYVQYFDDADPGTALNDHETLLTYNTSEGSDGQLWIEDHFWPFKSKAAINYTGLSFPETATTENLEDPGTNVRIIDGKVLKGAGRSKSGVIVDSIYLKLEFLDDDPGVIYQVRGHLKTGFFEDEY